MVNVRPVQLDDVEALYKISLATGFEGGDASHLYTDARLIGHVYAAPYALLEPRLALVIEDAYGVAGFAVGAIDTTRWEDRLEKEWWPQLRPRYVDPPEASKASWSSDERRASMIHHPTRTPAEVTGKYPAHIHLNLFPRLQGRGFGSKLLEDWQRIAGECGAKGIHVGVNHANQRAIRFWAKVGFTSVTPVRPATGRTLWMGRD